MRSRGSRPPSGQATPHRSIAEYIVVGSGAGGGTVAARLAESGSACSCSRRAVIPDPAGRRSAGPGATRSDDYDVPAFHPLATENEAMRWDFFVRHYEDDDRQRRDPNYRDTFDGPRRRWRPVPARRHARRVHGAQRDDPGVSARLRLEPDRRHDRRFVVARGTHARLLRAARELPPPAVSNARWSKFGINPEPARLGRLAARPRRPIPSAAHRGRDLRSAIVESAQCRAGVTPRRARRSRRRSKAQADPNDWRVVSRERRRRALYADDDAQSRACRHARAAARRAAAGIPTG